METISLVLMRHARSRADDEEVHEGWYDSPLTEAGRTQVRARAIQFVEQDFQFDKIIASPFLRAHETAQIIGEILNCEIETDDDWKELNNGPLAGMSREEAEQRYPRPDFRNPYEPFWETGEGDWAGYRRASRAMESVIRRGPGTYLVVAHGGILNHAMRTIVGASPPINWQGILFAFGDTGFTRLTYKPKTHHWILREFAPGL